MTMSVRRIAVLALTAALAAGAWAARPSTVASEMVKAARQFLSQLPPEQRALATIPFEDENRTNWHYIPRARRGVPLKALSPDQRKLAEAWLASGLSADGATRVKHIMGLESVLYDLEGQNATRDPERYYLTAYGDPAEHGTWGWRFEGHHVSVNFTLRGGEVVGVSPLFFGSNPAIIPRGVRAGFAALPEEESLARHLLKTFQGSARQKVIIKAEAPADIITAASRKAEPGPPVGVSYREMSKDQEAALEAIIRLYASRWRSELAEAELKKIRQAGLDQVYFAWAGGSEPGQPHYYRIQGPTFIIELDNTQNNANHIHSVWRNLDSDFGYDALRAHYETSPHHQHEGK
jgi:hypothetical protein